MLHPLNSMIGDTIKATDGNLGKLHEFYFDDGTWTIRYMVVETGTWLAGRKVLIGLVALGKPDWEKSTFSVNLTCAQVRNSPVTDTERPVYRQHEVDLHSYYDWPTYWDGGYGGTFGITPFPLLEDSLEIKIPPEPDKEYDPHLRSTRQMIGYHIHATDGEIGHLTDFIVDEDNWTITNLVIETGGWFMGKKVLVEVKWVKEMQWSDEGIYLDLSKDTIKSSAEFDPSKTILRKRNK